MDEVRADWFEVMIKATTADEGIDQLLPDELKRGTTNEDDQDGSYTLSNYKLSIEAQMELQTYLRLDRL